ASRCAGPLSSPRRRGPMHTTGALVVMGSRLRGNDERARRVQRGKYGDADGSRLCPHPTTYRSRNERAAAGVDGLPGEEAGAGAAQKADDGGDVLRRAALARQRAVDLVVVRLDEVALPRGGDEPGSDTVHRDVVAGEIVGERPGEPDEAGLRRHHMHAV